MRLLWWRSAPREPDSAAGDDARSETPSLEPPVGTVPRPLALTPLAAAAVAPSERAGVLPVQPLLGTASRVRRSGDAALPFAELEPPGPRTRVQRFRAWRFAPIVEVIATIGLALLLAESVQAAIVKPFVIPSESMQPTLVPNQRVLVNRLAYDFGSPHRGDIVVFHPPASLSCPANVPTTEPCPQSDPHPAGSYFVKRVIGVPGDRLSLRDGHPVIDGHELTDEPYITPCGGASDCTMPRAITVPRGEYFMLGDNRGDSDDSRFWGPVPESWIIGEVFATYWPPDRIGFF